MKQKITLEYNGKIYPLIKGDIPNLDGSGRIIIKRRFGGLQQQRTEGNFRNIALYQDNGGSYINGVNIESLVKRLEERK